VLNVYVLASLVILILLFAVCTTFYNKLDKCKLARKSYENRANTSCHVFNVWLDIIWAQTVMMLCLSLQEHVEKAITLNPKDPTNYYLLGRWCYGVCNAYSRFLYYVW